jgi:MEMO1 family protein
VEAIIPFLQYYNRDVEIIPILVTTMSVDTMQAIADLLAASIQKITSRKNLKWGEDFAFVISNDAVHYGDEEWGGKNFATFGSDSSGFTKAVDYEHKLIQDYLVPKTDTSKIKSFISCLVNKNFEYKWTWCGRNSVPFGLLTALSFQRIIHAPELDGILMGYSTSISHEPIRVNDIFMGITAPANIHHWVGYIAMVYK